MMNLNASATSANNLRAFACVEIFGREMNIEMRTEYFENAARALDMPVGKNALLAYIEQYGETPYVANVQPMPVIKFWFDAENTLWVVPL